METKKFDELLLKTAFCCMASDGDIDKREVAIIQSICEALPSFENIDLKDEMNRYVSEINLDSKQFITDYFTALEQADLTEQNELVLIDVAIQVIKADDVIEYSEIKFFKNIRYRLAVSDEKIIEHFSSTVEEIDQFLGEDIITESFLDEIAKQYFDTVNLTKFDFILKQ
ncbi:MAG: TerB family tellurite resistance protein [Prevotellaceae bacterium]|jgi:tellurite resistance protein|nr:TerB family tellurite resistance protein [Prevotellaceae bacterium]